MDRSKPLQIAIDGPVGSGKGTLAVALSKKLHAIHIYTGGMYRALTLACIRDNVDIHNEEEVMNTLRKSSIDLGIEEDAPLTKVFLNGENIEYQIFMPEVSNKTPIVASHKKVREEMVRRQQDIAEGRKGVIEGRDIALHVLPNADLKIFLTASVEERARRRLNQLHEKHVNITYDEVKQDIIKRDASDEGRQNSPLAISPDALIIDTTGDSIDDTVNRVMDELKNRNLL